MDKDALAIAKARAHYGEHLEELQIAGLILNVSDPGGLTSFDLTGTAVLVGAVWDGARVTRMIVTGDSGGETALQAAGSHAAPVPPAIHPNLGAAVPVYQVSAVELEFSASDKDARQDVALVFRLDSDPAQNVLFKVDCILPKNETRASLMTFASPLLSLELLNHLNENSLYYSQQIWLSFDAGLLMIQLSPYKYDGKRLIECIDPTPVSAAGNCLVFRWKDESSAEWQTWKRENFDETKVEVDLVALPTGGVFAEAIPGRFNSAEKLDISRFWNWQDSPIPIQAPEIAAIQAGQRQIAGTPQTGSLEPPVVSIQNAPALPDPTGMSAIISALTAANMFRDMSGTAQTAALAQAALQASGQATQAAMGQAGANMATAGQFQLELTKMLIGAALGIPTVPGPGLKNITTAGATINHGAKMDAAADSGTVNGPNPPPIDGGASGGLGGGGGGGAAVTARSRPSNEQVAFASTVAGNSGFAGNVINAGVGAFSSTQRTALLVFQENSGKLGTTVFGPLLGGLDAATQKMIEDTVDYWIEEFEKAFSGFADAVGRQYNSVEFLEDATAVPAKFKERMKALANQNFTIDVITIGHGSDKRLVGFGGESITDLTLRELKTEFGRALPIRMVYMMNCQGKSMNPAWIDAGAKVAGGSRGDNWMPEPMLRTFWKNWIGGMNFANATTDAYLSTKGIWNFIYKDLNLIPAGVNATQALNDSEPIVLGDGAVSIGTNINLVPDTIIV